MGQCLTAIICRYSNLNDWCAYPISRLLASFIYMPYRWLLTTPSRTHTPDVGFWLRYSVSFYLCSSNTNSPTANVALRLSYLLPLTRRKHSKSCCCAISRVFIAHGQTFWALYLFPQFWVVTIPSSKCGLVRNIVLLPYNIYIYTKYGLWTIVWFFRHWAFYRNIGEYIIPFPLVSFVHHTSMEFLCFGNVA